MIERSARAAAAPLRRAAFGIALGTALLACPLLAQPNPGDFLARVETGLRAARTLADPAKRRAACAALLAEAFDTTALAEAAAGPDWGRLVPMARDTLVAAIRLRLGAECANLLARPDPGSPTILRQRETHAGLSVTTRLPDPDGGGTILTWTLAPGGPWGWHARDLVAEGRGLAATIRGEFAAHVAMRDGDLAGAVAAFGAGAAR